MSNDLRKQIPVSGRIILTPSPMPPRVRDLFQTLQLSGSGVFGAATLTSGEPGFDRSSARQARTLTVHAIIRSLLDSLLSGQQSVAANKKHRTRIRMHQGETS
jgi:hypothetical protein